jgi:acyl carrier protein
MNQSPDIEQIVHDFIYRQFPLARRKQIDHDASLLDGGIVDSLGILDIVNFIETEFSITLTDEELLSGHFDSIRSLSSFLRSKIDHQQPI